MFSFYTQDKRVQAVLNHYNSATPFQILFQNHSFDSVFLHAIVKNLKGKHIIVLKDREQALEIMSDWKVLRSDLPFLLLEQTTETKNKYSYISKNKVSDRMVAIDSLQKHQDIVALTYPEALIEKIAEAQKFSKAYKKGENIHVQKFIELCEEMGFDRVPFVYEYGQFAVRGNIIDVYSYAHALPYRIELFDTEIEEIRTFDIENQLSIDTLDSLILSANITRNKETVLKSIFEVMPTQTHFWIYESKKMAGRVQDAIQFFNEHTPEDVLKELPKDYVIKKSDLKLLEHFKHVYELQNQVSSKSDIETFPSISMEPTPLIYKNFNKLCQEIERFQEDGYEVHLMCEDEKQFDRYDAIFRDLSKNIVYQKTQGEFVKGYVDAVLKKVFFTSHEIFQRFKKVDFTKKNATSAQAIMLKSIKELKPGDFVTHIDHGVGRFSGLEKLEVNGHTQEAVRLIYANNDILYVHVNSLYKISKFVGKEGLEPKLNKIGSDSWQAIKRKTKKRIKDIAEDLIKLYAKRKSSKGFAYSPDTYMQYELESSFEYEDTPDQATATQAIKADMEKEIPMDRLVCGDVGFGKTEVAIRAAFKAVADSKQVAVLVPTTILAFQHYRTFKERLKEMPCRMEFINRFKTAKQKKEIFADLEAGKIDILIGTHALVGDKVKFKDLGLLIIDEEQKFGVAVKEKLKQFKLNVDTLTLTATPIPRTLQFSLLGARDYSLIQTPPPNRIAVYTEIAQFEPEFIKEVIENEVFRGGQVFFVNNRIKELEQLKATLQNIMPNVEMVLAHGQLDGDKLEEIFVDFMDKKYDVLFSTNIIESGIDIPNANTIIINNAHQFGMSDLHQMRGRVGRSNKKAYCYLLCPNIHSLTNEAKQRLRAIEQNAELGSGFQIAMRDLDLRGAGNLLGGEQSGFISDIGYDTFMKIMDETITELKEGEYSDLYETKAEDIVYAKDCVIESDFDLFIPDEYIPQSQERMNIYTEFNQIENEHKMQKYLTQLKDKFGKFPPQVFEICNAIRLKWVATKLGIERIILKNGKMKCYLIQNQDSRYYQSDIFGKLLQFVSNNPVGINMKQTPQHLIIEFSNVSSSESAKVKLERVA
jgi:transcription-repair coupling factor (superfamily II helicase)